MTCRLLVGDARDVLKTLPEKSVHCVVTSPPYFGLRSYGTKPQMWSGDTNCEHDWLTDRYYVEGGGGAGSSKEAFSEPGPSNAERIKQARWREDNTCQKCEAWRGHLGLEPSLQMFIDHLVAVFREVRRVMRDDATLWLNLGDSYAGSWGNQGRKDERGTQRSINGPMLQPLEDGRYPSNGHNTGTINDSYLKPKDLMMVPARVAIALCDDGWYLRSDVIWAKKAPMPESVTDRPTSAHEHVFLLTKKARYFYDAEAVKEDVTGGTHDRGTKMSPPKTMQHKDASWGIKSNQQFMEATWGMVSSRNLRNVWHLGPEPYPDAHFAVYPTEIPKRAILAGTSAKGCCAACGSPFVRMMERTGEARQKFYSGANEHGSDNRRMMRNGQFHAESQTIGWQSSCSCDAGEPIPCTVIDPFAGAGTTLLVADRLGRDAIGIELSESYAEMARKRIYNDAPLFAEVTTT